MKKLSFALIAFLGLGMSIARAQAPCTPNPSSVTLNPQKYLGAAAFAPDPLPEATVGQAYDQVIQFKAVKNLSVSGLTVVIKSVKVIGFKGAQVANAYDWINYQVASANPADVTTGDTITVTPAGDTIAGCIRMTGTPTCKTEAGKDTILLVIKVVPENQGLQGIIDAQIGEGIELQFKVNGTATDPVCEAASIADAIRRQMNLSVFPTPTNGNVKVSYNLPVFTDVTAEVYSADGRLVYSRVEKNPMVGENTMEIPAENFVPGLYVVNLKVAGTTVSKKLVRN
jgi:hypothetical protein